MEARLTLIAKRSAERSGVSERGVPDSNPGSPSRHRLARLSPTLICRLDRTTDLMSSYAAPASELANAGGVQGARATGKHMRHKIRCASKQASENKRARAGEATAGGAADWNGGVPVAVGAKASKGSIQKTDLLNFETQRGISVSPMPTFLNR